MQSATEAEWSCRDAEMSILVEGMAKLTPPAGPSTLASIAAIPAIVVQPPPVLSNNAAFDNRTAFGQSQPGVDEMAP